jgi:hypothetical protein
MPSAGTSVHFQLAHVLTGKVPELVGHQGLTAGHRDTPEQKQVFLTDYATIMLKRH